jgi:myo-inositol-1-phosphate synthase
MTISFPSNPGPLLLLIAGAKGAVASTVAVAVRTLQRDPESILSSLTTADKFPYLGPPQSFQMAGWDQTRKTLGESIEDHGVLPERLWKPDQLELNQITIREAPGPDLDFRAAVERLREDIRFFCDRFPAARPVFVNLLPAAPRTSPSDCQDLSELYSQRKAPEPVDLAYTAAAVLSGVPVVNFSPNEIEIPSLLHEAVERGVPLAGRDGKTGQTYLKVVLASALKARRLYVDGWYSLNILGNADGKNLMEPGKAEGKLMNKTEILDEILGYPVGERYQAAAHKVHIDYYPPRGDAKEAWDVIDFLGLFGLPMSLRLNLQGRDSILAAPLVLDLARWMIVLQKAGKSGLVPELGFYFKKPLGANPPLTYEDQLVGLHNLEESCNRVLSPLPSSTPSGSLRSPA